MKTKRSEVSVKADASDSGRHAETKTLQGVSEKADASDSGRHAETKKFLPGIAAQDSFRRQIILTFVVGFFLLVTGFTAYQFRTESAFLYRESTNETTSLAESLAASSRSWVLANDVAGLQEVVHAFQAHPELRYAMVISPAGQVLAHTDAKKVGQFVADEQSRVLIKSPHVKRIMIDDESMSDIAVPIMVDQRFVGWARIGQGRSVIADNLHKMMLSSALFVLAAVTLSLLAALFIANRLGYRIGYLMRVAEEVEAGNYASRAHIAGADEIAKLAGSFNHMLDVLAREEEQLKESENRYRMLVQSAPMCIHEIGMDGRISSMNRAGLTMMGVDEECKVQGFLYLDAVCDADRERIGGLLAQAYTGEASYFEFKASGPAGLIFKSCFVPIKDQSGSVVKLMGITEDITERKQAEFDLRQSEEGLKEAQRLAKLGSWHMNLATNEVVWSEVLYKMYGFDPALPPPLYTESMKLFTPESWERLSTSIAKCVETGTPYELELEMVPKDGSAGWMLARGELVRDEYGAPVRVRGIVMDITERKLAENAIREKEERLALATVNNGVGIWDWNLQTQQMIWDDSMYALYHIRREDFSGTEEAWRASLHPDDLTRGDKEVEAAIAGIRPFNTEFRVVWPNGEIRHIKAVAKVFRDDQGKPSRMLGINMDITDRKKAEEQLRELNDDFVTLLENTGDFIYFKDKESRIRFCSQTLANVTGHHSWRDMIGKHDQEVFPKDVAQVYYEEELPIFQQGKALLNKTDPYYDDQGKPGWVNTNKWPVFGDDRKTVVGIFGISRDITELKEAEDKIIELNRDLERRVTERTAQLEAANNELESFSYSVSHDLRTPLRAIDGFSHILLEDYADKLDDEGKRLLKVVRDNTNRMSQLIDDILKFSRSGRLAIAYAEIDMEKMAHDVIAELQPVIEGSKLQVEVEHIPPARGDSAMMHQVFVNLLSNAIKFSRTRETPKIRVGASVTDDETIYYVKDNGVGFDMQYAGKLFGVFQRLHGVTEFEGTGIGLAIVKRIITRHGGRVWAESQINEGATMYFTLPANGADHG